MKKYLAIYNPSSGKEQGAQKIFHASRQVMEKEDVEITFFATKKKGDGESAALRGCNSRFDLIIACGGDGTVHEVVNGIMKSNNKSKLAVLPHGTVNDFAAQLKLPKTSSEFSAMLSKQNYKTIDVGKINEDYFINVVGGGAFTNIPHDVTVDSKTILGKYAYYYKAAIEIPGQLDNSYNVVYTIDDKIYEINSLLFLIINTSGAGGFKKLCPKAKIDDGLFDIVIFEKANHGDLLQIFTGVFNGQHIRHPKVHYHQAKYIKIETDKKMTIDVDGEFGGYAPFKITSVQQNIDVLVP